MRRLRYVVGLLCLLTCPTNSQAEPDYPSAKVSYADFKTLVDTVEAHRSERLVGLDRFLEMSKEPNTIILDTRSAERFARIHVSGAKHLNFADFNQGSLAELIPDPNTRILIYCNNNFEGNPIDFTTKVALPPSLETSTGASGSGTEMLGEQRPVMMALNVPTYINLYGYGYRNVYELDELVNISDSRVQFEGSSVGSVPLIALPSIEVPASERKRKKRRR